MTLSTECRSPYCVWLDADCAPDVRWAGEQLCLYLRRITGALIPLISGGDVPERAFVVGSSPALLALGADVSGLGGEGYLIRTLGSRLAIAGETGRGTVYGVFSFLEDALGCRFYTETIERVPKRPTLEIGEMDVRETPALEYRDTYYVAQSVGGEWAAKNKHNGQSAHLRDHQGGCVRYFPFVHSFENLLPVKEHFDAHPEYYSMVNGERIRERPQLCLSNPEVVRLCIEKVRAWIAQHPEASIISVSQNDWFNPCQCPACRAIDEREGSHAGSLIAFVNQIAEAIEKDHPNVVIDTLAYQYTRVPPKFIRPRPNVCVRLCSIECCFAHPLEECERMPSCWNREHGDSFQADLEGWSKVCDRLYVWDYVVNFRHYEMPFFNFDVLAPNIRYFVKNHVKGIFEEGSTTSYGGVEWDSMRAWVLTKLLWRPELDTDELVSDFIGGVYGAAAPKILAYYKLLQSALRANPEAHFGIYDPPRSAYITDEVTARAQALFDEAEALADTPEVLERVRTARLPIRYWALLNQSVGAPGRDEAIDAFERDLRARCILQTTEGRPLDHSIQELRGGLKYTFPEA